jgi:kynurenine formamidase
VDVTRRLSYQDLLARTDAPPGSAWGLRGEEDLGAVADLTPERVVQAARLARRGAVFNLDYPMNTFDPPVSPTRRLAEHHIFGNSPNHRDDYLDAFYLQAGSHVDGLRHMRSADHGWYNGIADSEVAPGSPALGVNRWAEHGIIGRGILADVERHRRNAGRPLDQRSGEAFPIAAVEETLADQGTDCRPGDLLLLRTGWAAYYLSELAPAGRQALQHHLVSPGLAQDHATLAWLWDHDVVAVASDNAAVECLPPVESSPFATPAKLGAGGPAFVARMMHDHLISLLGIVIGELWNLEGLADDCAADGVYEFMLVCKPLNLLGGVGSPANALAIK